CFANYTRNDMMLTTRLLLNCRVRTDEQRHEDRSEDQIRASRRKEFSNHSRGEAKAIDEDIRKSRKENAQNIPKHSPGYGGDHIFIARKCKADNQYNHQTDDNGQSCKDRN